MMGVRKIQAGKGRLVAAYYAEGTSLRHGRGRDETAAAPSERRDRDAGASWRQDMDPAVARALGIDLTKPPTLDVLETLFDGRRADDGKAWTKGSRRISAHDCTFSVDKSVSLAVEFAQSDEEKAAILQAIWRANDQAMRYAAQEMGWARRGNGGRNGAEAGKVGWASFMHFTARPTHHVQDGPDGRTLVRDIAVPGDPQIHIHNPLWNVVVTGSGHVGSLDSKRMHGRVKEFGGYFQAILANELAGLGIQVGYDRSEQAVVIECIP